MAGGRNKSESATEEQAIQHKLRNQKAISDPSLKSREDGIGKKAHDSKSGMSKVGCL